MKVAAFYEILAEEKVQCRLCPHHCVLMPQAKGVCGARENRLGRLISLNYGQIGALQLDPVEKKPLYHFHPGRKIASVGTFGCNFNCSFCQNWHLSKGDRGSWQLEPEELVDQIVQRYGGKEGNLGIAFTYNEPLVWYEYLLEAGRLAKKAGLNVVIVTNGFLNAEPWQNLLQYVDALNIDLKAFQEKFYRNNCGGKLEPVLKNIETAHEHCHVEVTTLLIPGLNDSEEEITELAAWLGNLHKDIPLHLSRYFPNYQLERPPTPINKLIKARTLARQHLNYVYVGNAPQLGNNNTYCPRCELELITRDGYRTVVKGLAVKENGNSYCRRCQEQIAVVLT